MNNDQNGSNVDENHTQAGETGRCLRKEKIGKIEGVAIYNDIFVVRQRSAHSRGGQGTKHTATGPGVVLRRQA
jgi:hypothetical protein